jgi:FkbM family methyltransferase
MPQFSIYDLEIEVPQQLLAPGIELGLKRGWYERDEVEIARSRLVAGDRVLELGTGLGVTALVAARIVGPAAVIGFEANPALLPVARANAARNSLAVQFHNRLLYPRTLLPGPSVEFAIADEFWASGVAEAGSTGTRVPVPTGVLEDEIGRFGANALIMDIEGLEVDIIEAADLSRIDKFIFEIHYDKRGRPRTDAAIARLQQGGWAVDYQLCSRGVLYLARPAH